MSASERPADLLQRRHLDRQLPALPVSGEREHREKHNTHTERETQHTHTHTHTHTYSHTHTERNTTQHTQREKYNTHTHITFNIYAFSRRFYPKRLIQVIHLYCQYVCSLGIEPTTFALLTQCSTTEPQEHTHTQRERNTTHTDTHTHRNTTHTHTHTHTQKHNTHTHTHTL